MDSYTIIVDKNVLGRVEFDVNGIVELGKALAALGASAHDAWAAHYNGHTSFTIGDAFFSIFRKK